MQYKCMRAEKKEAHGPNSQAMDRTLEHPTNITDATSYMSRIQKSKQISDTVFIKHKYITQSLLVPANTLVIVINNLACALKGAWIVKGIQHIERMKNFHKLPKKIPTDLAKMLDPPVTIQQNKPTPRVEYIRPCPPLSINQPLLPNKNPTETTSEPAVRVQKEKENMSTRDRTKSKK